jgi:hypothetical protein
LSSEATIAKKKSKRRSTYQKVVDRMSKSIDSMANATGKTILRLVGQAPNWKERLTWTNKHRRVRYDKSRGQGYNKRHLRTSEWFKTAAIICLVARTGHASAQHKFDSDSVTIHIDNCASRCISNSISDFVKPPQKVIGRVKGMGGDNVAVKGVGTLRWTFDDENGLSHIFLIPGSLYIPDSPARLFSPQHWAQERKDDVPVRNGTWQATFADHVLLVWGQQKYRKKIEFDKSNVATFTTSAGCKNFRIFRACLDAEGDETASKDSPGQYTAFDATLIEDDEDDDVNDESAVENPEDDETIMPVSTNKIRRGMIRITTTVDQGTRRQRDTTIRRTTHTKTSRWSKTLRTILLTASSNRVPKCCYGTIVWDISRFQGCKRWPRKGYYRNDLRHAASLSAHLASMGK